MISIDRIFALALVVGSAGGCITIQTPGSNNTNAPAQPTASRARQPSTPGSVNGQTISAEMTDEQILAAFDVDIKIAVSNVARGPDGYSTTYKLNEQNVSITRSVVTGVYVNASGGRIKGEWRLGGGN